MNLPELPAELDRLGYGCGVEGLRSLVRAYGEECARMERERCAKICDGMVNNATDWDSSFWDQCAARCAFAIRKEPE